LDYIDNFVLKEGFYESEVLEAVLPSLGPGAVLWVVGCNFGLHAVTAKWLHPETRVVAFEPLPSMGVRLAENCLLNGVEVELHACALSDSAGVLPFFVNAAGNPAMSTLHPDPAGTYDQRLTVATLTAADVVARGLAPAPTVAIIDAEGAEAEVLRGFGSLLATPKLRTIVFEAPNDFLATHRPGDLFQALDGAGFCLRRLVRRENTAHALSNFTAVRAGES
jgi:FkbM family methyltransferase